MAHHEVPSQSSPIITTRVAGETQQRLMLLANGTVTAPGGGSTALLRVEGAPNTHLLIVNRVGGAPTNGNVLLVTGNDHSDEGDMDTTFGISGYETGKGTIKVSHVRPTAGGTINDANASAISIRCNGTGTAAQGIFFDAEDGGTTGKLMNFRQNGTAVWVIDANGNASVGGLPLQDPHYQRNGSAGFLSTMDELVAQGQMSLTSGTMYGVAAWCGLPGTYQTIRFITGGTTPSALTDVKLCVWNSSGTLLSASSSIHGSVTTANTIYEAQLGSGVTLTQGQQVYLGIAWTGTTLNVRGSASVAALTASRTGKSLVTARAASGYAGGTPGTLTSGSTGSVPWLELTT